jgi:signal transduction histidine kinase
MEVKYETEKKDLHIAEMEREKVLYIWLSIAGGAFLLSLLILFIILHRLAVAKSKVYEQQVQQVEQEKQIVATQSVLDGETAERTRVARDLHDGLGGMLSVVQLHLDDVEHLQDAREMLAQSIDELRRVAHHMMPASLLRYGLKAALEDFCLSVPNVQFNYFGDESPLDDRIAILIYRCTYELVNNAIKYANASAIQVQLFQDAGRISLTVEDDGNGFDTETTPPGMGLDNLRARVAAGKGTLNLHSEPGKGTEVYIELPVK